MSIWAQGIVREFVREEEEGGRRQLVFVRIEWGDKNEAEVIMKHRWENVGGIVLAKH
jgi:hypothetical protein